MSKLNNRKDIKQKEELQAQFQLAISKANETVLSWLRPGQVNSTLDTDLSVDALQFLNLPVIPLGQGLSLSESNEDDESNIHTIGDFINGDKKLSSLAKKKRAGATLSDRINRINNRHKISKNDNRALVGLKNKLRNDTRNQVRRDNNIAQSRNNSVTRSAQKTRVTDDDDDEDEDEKHLDQRNTKKGSGLLFDTRTKKRG